MKTILSLCLNLGLAVMALVLTGAPAQAQTPPTTLSVGSKFVEGQCLETRADASLIISKCNAQSAQILRYDEETGRLHQGELCVAAETRGQPLMARPCGDGAEQKWTFAEDATLRSDANLCADILNFRRDPGTTVIAWDCTATDNQKFFATRVKVEPTKQTAQAAVAPPPIQGTPVVATYYVQGRCLTVTSRSTVTIDVCERAGTRDFRFRGGPSGQIVQGDKCLAVSQKGEPLVVKPCTSGPEQDWSFTSEGTLRNRQDLCADIFAFETRNGTNVIAWDCTGTDNQKFYPALAAASGSVSLGEQLAKSLAADAKVTTVSMAPGYSAYNLTGAGGRTLSADADGRITGGQGDTIVVGGAGVLTVRFANGLAAPGVKAEFISVTNILPKDWAFFSGDNAGKMEVR